jgi:hypothetical protein
MLDGKNDGASEGDNDGCVEGGMDGAFVVFPFLASGGAFGARVVSTNAPLLCSSSFRAPFSVLDFGILVLFSMKDMPSSAFVQRQYCKKAALSWKNGHA